MREADFQAQLKRKLREEFPGCVILKNDANDIQGFPDLLVLHRAKWAALEVKRDASSARQPNQAHYVQLLGEMSYATFVYPENLEEVLNALRETFRPRGKARVSQR